MTSKATLLSMIVLGVLGTVTMVAWAGETNERDVTIDQVPVAVKAAILKAADGARITEIEEVTKDGRTFYEAEFRRNGREVEIHIAADGTLLGRQNEHEDDEDDDLSLKDIPAPARSALRTAVGGARIAELERETRGGVTIYEAAWKRNGVWHEAAVTADGLLVETEEHVPAADVPDVVKTVINERFGPDAKVSVARKMIVVYEIETRINDREVELLVSPTGRVRENAQPDDDDGDNGNDDGDDDGDDGEEEDDD